MLSYIFDDAPERTRGKVVGMYAVLVGANIAAWAWAFATFHGNSLPLGTAFLAYSFGLRHAFDVDAAAIVTDHGGLSVHLRFNKCGSGDWTGNVLGGREKSAEPHKNTPTLLWSALNRGRDVRCSEIASG
jgi:hypothetical protein